MNSMVRNLVPMGKRAYKKRATGKIKSNATLTKKVNQLARKANAGETHLQIYKVITSTNLSAPLDYFNLMDYVNFAPCFGCAVGDYASANKFLHKKTSLDFLFDYGNETDNIDISCFLVQLKGLAGDKYNRTTGALTLASPIDYLIPSSPLANLVTLNPKMFKVLKSKRFRLGNNGVAIATSTANDSGRVSKKFRWTFNINKTIGSAIGNVQQQVVSPSPSNQYYVLMFNNNNAIDLQYPIYNVQVIHDIIVPN